MIICVTSQGWLFPYAPLWDTASTYRILIDMFLCGIKIICSFLCAQELRSITVTFVRLTGCENSLETGSAASRDIHTAASLSAKCVRLVRSSWKKCVTEYFGIPKILSYIWYSIPTNKQHKILTSPSITNFTACRTVESGLGTGWTVYPFLARGIAHARASVESSLFLYIYSIYFHYKITLSSG